MEEFFEILAKSIIEIENIYTGEIFTGKFDINYYKSKYSSYKGRLILKVKKLYTNRLQN